MNDFVKSAPYLQRDGSGAPVKLIWTREMTLLMEAYRPLSFNDRSHMMKMENLSRFFFTGD